MEASGSVQSKKRFTKACFQNFDPVLQKFDVSRTKLRLVMKYWLPLGDHAILGELALRKHTHLTIERTASADRFLSVAFALFNTRDIGLVVIDNYVTGGWITDSDRRLEELFFGREMADPFWIQFRK